MTNQEEIIKVIELIKNEVRKYDNSLMNKVANKTNDPFKVLISCLLSLRTRDETTDVIAENLFKVAKTPKDFTRLPLKKLEKIIRPVNYYKTKSKRIKEISKIIYRKYNSKVPNNREELLKLKGVGAKTSAIVMTYGFDDNNAIASDVNVHKISNRLGWVKTKKYEDTEIELKKIIPKKYWIDINETFVIFGKKICTSVSPFCSKCQIRRYCPKIDVKSSR